MWWFKIIVAAPSVNMLSSPAGRTEERLISVGASFCARACWVMGKPKKECCALMSHMQHDELFSSKIVSAVNLRMASV